MACVGCPPPKEPEVQKAVRFKAWYIGGFFFEGDSSAWGEMPDDGMLAVKVFFNDDTARNCAGNDWYGLLVLSPDSWTVIHNNNTDNDKRYPTALWKRGKWTTEDEMHQVIQKMSD
jgi:hypothetical protein